MLEKLISIVVPVYNTELFLERCISSILAQSYSNIELILIDDGSTDKSGMICDEYARQDNRVVVYHQTNCGVSNARNEGIKRVKGDFITFVDADDELVPRALEIASRKLQESSADVVVYGWKSIDEGGITKEFSFTKFEVIEDTVYVLKEILKNYSSYGGGYPWNKMWQIKVFLGSDKKTSFFNEKLYYFEDLEWVIRMICRIKKMVVCPECLYNYYTREGSVTNSVGKLEERELGYHHSIEEIIRDLEKQSDIQKWFCDKYYPEIVNGIIGAIRKKQKNLLEYLKGRLEILQNDILCSKNISFNIKMRCIYLIIMFKLKEL